MKSVKRVTALILAFVFALQTHCVSYCSDVDSVSSDAFTEEDFLSAKGNSIYNAKGEKITLRGVNLGGWLVFEDWLCPYEEVSDNYEVIETLTERFGRENAYELLNTYYDNFITGYDLDCIK
ncbi:MAG: hypothetical protein IKH65_00690, partial [Clostridia bacterium]|nr:hypothetical protein [Clostridia bacterium]